LPIQARAILERIRGTKAVDAEFDDIKLAAQVANSVRRASLLGRSLIPLACMRSVRECRGQGSRGNAICCG
jgi:hypothetical protein